MAHVFFLPPMSSVPILGRLASRAMASRRCASTPASRALQQACTQVNTKHSVVSTDEVAAAAQSHKALNVMASIKLDSKKGALSSAKALADPVATYKPGSQWHSAGVPCWCSKCVASLMQRPMGTQAQLRGQLGSHSLTRHMHVLEGITCLYSSLLAGRHRGTVPDSASRRASCCSTGR